MILQMCGILKNPTHTNTQICGRGDDFLEKPSKRIRPSLDKLLPTFLFLKRPPTVDLCQHLQVFCNEFNWWLFSWVLLISLMCCYHVILFCVFYCCYSSWRKLSGKAINLNTQINQHTLLHSSQFINSGTST